MVILVVVIPFQTILPVTLHVAQATTRNELEQIAIITTLALNQFVERARCSIISEHLHHHHLICRGSEPMNQGQNEHNSWLLILESSEKKSHNNL